MQSTLVRLFSGFGLIALACGFLGALSVAAQGDSTPVPPISNGYPVTAYLCETDPGQRGVAEARPLPSDCVVATGIVITISLEDGTVLGTCTLDGDLCAVADLPTDPGTTLVFTEDVSTVPSGYAPVGNPLTAGNYGEFRGVSFYNVATGGAADSAEPSSTTTASDETDGSTAAIFSSDCAGDFTQDPIAGLTNVRAGSGEVRGAADASAVETSFTTLDLSLDAVLADDHVLVVFDEDDDSVVLVCGAIGGVLTDDRTLTFGLPAVGESRFSGVAYLSEEDNQTLVTVFLAQDLSVSVTPEL